MNRKLALLALMAALVTLPGSTALSSHPAPSSTLELAGPLMSVDGFPALHFAEQGWCTSKICFTYCGPDGGYYIGGGGGVPCICCG